MRLFPNRTTERVSSWMFWRWTTIPGTSRLPYLTRLYLVNTPWFGVKLHWLHRPDPDRDPHDHPWGFLSFVLQGWYQEELLGGQIRMRRKRSWARYSAASIHRIINVSPGTVTLVINGPVRATWGFHVKAGRDVFDQPQYVYVPWREYLGVPKDAPEV